MRTKNTKHKLTVRGMKKWKVKVFAEITVEVPLQRGCDLALETTNIIRRDFGGKVVRIIKCN